MAEIDEWITDAEKTPAKYDSLVSDHNYTWSNKFSKEGAYLEELKSVREELAKEFAKLTLADNTG